MATTPVSSDNSAHVRWRKVGESVTSPYSNTKRKEVFLDPCECIKKLFDAAPSAAENPPSDDWAGDKKARAVRNLRGVRRFHADWKAYEFGKTAEAVYGDSSPGKWRVATEAQLKEYGLGSFDDLKIKSKSGPPSKFKCQLYVPDDLRFCEAMPAILVFKGTTLDEMEDWLNNLEQGVDAHSDYYEKAVVLGFRHLSKAKKPIVVIGHSLGGGLDLPPSAIPIESRKSRVKVNRSL